MTCKMFFGCRWMSLITMLCWCPGDVSVLFRWCHGGVSVVFRCFAMFRWCGGLRAISWSCPVLLCLCFMDVRQSGLCASRLCFGRPGRLCPTGCQWKMGSLAMWAASFQYAPPTWALQLLSDMVLVRCRCMIVIQLWPSIFKWNASLQFLPFSHAQL